MAFDGVTIANVVSELKKELMGGRLYKIAQPEEDELLLTIRQPKGQARLLISAEASAQASAERTDHRHFTAGLRAHRPYKGGTSGRNG